MEILLTTQESEKIFHTALCNGLQILSDYGLRFKRNQADYDLAKASLEKLNPGQAVCREDVYLRILKDGGTLSVKDIECDGAYDSTISLEDVHERVKMSPKQDILDIVEERDDAYSADSVLQTVFFKEIIFG